MEGTKSMLNKVYVGGIPAEASEKEVREHFGRFGALTDIVLIKDKHTKKSRGFGFVTFKEPKAVRRILKENLYLRGKLLEVKIAEPKKASKLQDVKDTSTITKVFVGGVPKEATVDDLSRYFSTFGRIRDASIIEDKKTNEPRGFGFVWFEEVESVRKVIEGYASHSILGKWVECKIALPKSSGDRQSLQGESDSSSPECDEPGLQHQKQKSPRRLEVAAKASKGLGGRDSCLNNQLKKNEAQSSRNEPKPRLSTKEQGRTKETSEPSTSSQVARTPLLSQERVICPKPRFLPILSDESNYSFRQSCRPISSYRTVRTGQSSFGPVASVFQATKVCISSEAIHQHKQESSSFCDQRHLNSESFKLPQFQRAVGMCQQASSSLSRCMAPLNLGATQASSFSPPQSDDMWRADPDPIDPGLFKYEGLSSNHSDEPSPINLNGGRWQDEQNAPDLRASDGTRDNERPQAKGTGPGSISINTNLQARQSDRSHTCSNCELDHLQIEGTNKSCRIEEAVDCKFLKNTDTRIHHEQASKQTQKKNLNLNGASCQIDPRRSARTNPNHETSARPNRSGFRAGTDRSPMN